MSEDQNNIHAALALTRLAELKIRKGKFDEAKKCLREASIILGNDFGYQSVEAENIIELLDSKKGNIVEIAKTIERTKKLSEMLDNITLGINLWRG